MNIKNQYFDWLYEQIKHPSHLYSSSSAHSITMKLYEINFEYDNDSDANRYFDGISLRYHYGLDHGYNEATIRVNLDNRPCSVFEMMVALAKRIEEIMLDPSKGDRTSEWFWYMMENLGFYPNDPTCADSDYISSVIECFHNKEYGPDGVGGLFYIENPHEDLRTVPIWTQANWYVEGLE